MLSHNPTGSSPPAITSPQTPLVGFWSTSFYHGVFRVGGAFKYRGHFSVPIEGMSSFLLTNVSVWLIMDILGRSYKHGSEFFLEYGTRGGSQRQWPQEKMAPGNIRIAGLHLTPPFRRPRGGRSRECLRGGYGQNLDCQVSGEEPAVVRAWPQVKFKSGLAATGPLIVSGFLQHSHP